MKTAAKTRIRQSLSRRCRVLAAMLFFLASLNARAQSSAKPQRALSICVQGDELLLQLLPRERIVAVTQFATDPDISAHWKEARGIKMIQGNAEELVQLKPDLVLASAYAATLTVAALRKQGVPVLELGIPNDFDELRDQIRLAGKSLGEEARAEEIVQAMDARLARLKANRPAPNARPAALFYFHDGFSPGGNTFPNAILEVAGFRNLGARFSSGFGVSAPLESVVMARPDLLILTRYREGNPTQTQFSESQPLFQKLGAFTKIVSVPFRQLASPDPSNLDLAELLQKYLPK